MTGHRTISSKLLVSLAFTSGVSLLLLFMRSAFIGRWQYSFLIWNLALAWLPLLLALLLNARLKKTQWLSASNAILTVLWLGFLPNSFYILSDLVHLGTLQEVNLLYDALMIGSFALNGLLLGYLSLDIVRKGVVKRQGNGVAGWFVGGVLLICSFAIYLGRFLRWNTWDILVDPAGLLFDVSDRVINPFSHARTFWVTGAFFAVLLSFYRVFTALCSEDTK